MQDKDKWYVLQVETGNEINIRDAISNLKNIKALVPRHMKIEKKRGKSKTIIRPIFQGYVFVKLNLNHHLYYKIRAIPKVYRFLGTDAPEALKPKEERYMFDAFEKSEVADVSNVIFEGNEIKVIDGILKGREGQIIKVDKRKNRAKVKFTILDKPVIVELSFNVIEASE